MSETDSQLQRLLFVIGISAIDIPLNAAAGAAAVAAGAHANGDDLTTSAIRVGVLAAVTKSGVRAFVAFLSLASIDIASWSLLIVVLTKFGIAVLVTAQVCSQVLGEVPSPLLIAAIVAAIPWQAEGYGFYMNCCGGRVRYSHSDGYRTTTTTTHVLDPCRFVSFYIYIIGWDALTGYTFARMAQNQDVSICALGAAAAAGAVFGVVSGISTVIELVVTFLLGGSRQTTVTYSLVPQLPQSGPPRAEQLYQLTTTASRPLPADELVPLILQEGAQQARAFRYDSERLEGVSYR